jgi:hypothetical protein
MSKEVPAKNRKLSWDKRKFLEHWVKHSGKTDWDEFYGAMKKACEEDTGDELTEVSLSARLGSFSRHLKGQGYQPPPRPERPQPTPETLGDIAKALGLGAYEGSFEEGSPVHKHAQKSYKELKEEAKDRAARTRAEMKSL